MKKLFAFLLFAAPAMAPVAAPIAAFAQTPIFTLHDGKIGGINTEFVLAPKYREPAHSFTLGTTRLFTTVGEATWNIRTGRYDDGWDEPGEFDVIEFSQNGVRKLLHGAYDGLLKINNPDNYYASSLAKYSSNGYFIEVPLTNEAKAIMFLGFNYSTDLSRLAIFVATPNDVKLVFNRPMAIRKIEQTASDFRMTLDVEITDEYDEAAGIEATTATIFRKNGVLWLTPTLQELYLANEDAVFFKFFPDSFDDFLAMYGESNDAEVSAPLTEHYQEHLDFLVNSKKINRGYVQWRFAEIAMNGHWEADAVGYLQMKLIELAKQDIDMTLEILNPKPNDRDAKFWRFLFDGPHPSGHKADFDTLHALVIDKNPAQARVMMQEYNKLLDEELRNHSDLGTVRRFLSPKGVLQAFGEVPDGARAGTWYYFDDVGRLLMTMTDFEPNTDPVIAPPVVHNAVGVWENRCRVTAYHPNGRKSEEGGLLFNEDPKLDDTLQYDEWKYYNTNGVLTKTKVFK